MIINPRVLLRAKRMLSMRVTAKKISNLGFLRSWRDHFTSQIHYFCAYIHGFHVFSCVRTFFSIFNNGGAIMRYPGLRPATVIKLYTTGLILHAPETASFFFLLFFLIPQKAIYSVTIFSFFLFFYFYSPIRLICWDATRFFLNETTAFTRRETDASLQGIGVFGTTPSKDHSRRRSTRIRSLSLSRCYMYEHDFILLHGVTARTQFATIQLLSLSHRSVDTAARDWLRWQNAARLDCRARATRWTDTRSTGTGNFDKRIKYKDFGSTVIFVNGHRCYKSAMRSRPRGRFAAPSETAFDSTARPNIRKICILTWRMISAAPACLCASVFCKFHRNRLRKSLQSVNRDSHGDRRVKTIKIDPRRAYRTAGYYIGANAWPIYVGQSLAKNLSTQYQAITSK